MRFLLIFAVLILGACSTQEEGPGELTLNQASYPHLKNWQNDSFDHWANAFRRSCERIIKRSPGEPFGSMGEAGTYGDWQRICKDFLALKNPDAQSIRQFLEKNFTPYEIRDGAKAEGLFTGYYEASLRGSRTRYGPYQTPLHARPGDLVMVNLGEFRDDLKGRRIAGRVVDGQLKPYENRENIVNGAWPHHDKVLVWVDDPVDAFFVQIQGSGVVEMDDGSVMRIGYAGQNGHPYYAVGRELIKRGVMDKDDVSMQSIRGWLEAHPQEAEALMNTNESYVFFQELTGDGPIGGEGLALTPMRSLAIDRSLLPYGLPLWVDIESPVQGYPDLQRLMIAQDTGGAIRGPVRGDVFWGYGESAENYAGVMKAKGRYWALLPRQVSPRRNS